jgi:vanillate O-demethylase monooxygenase subunit
LENQGVTAAIRASAEQAFCQEDKPILEKQQERMGTADFWSLKPVLLNVDAAAVKVRRKLELLIAAERGREPSLSAGSLQEAAS